MSATDIEGDRPDQSSCWCCGASVDPAELVRLGSHPEVGVCVRCARSIGKWAREIEDRSRAGVAVRLRGVLRRIRKIVVRQGWHGSPLIGRVLRWIGRHTP